jgi:antitoxin YefM
MDVITYSEARANLKDVMDEVVNDRTQVIVTRRKAASVVMVSLDDWNAMEETMHLLSSRANAQRLRESIDQMDSAGGAECDILEP